MLKVYFDGTAAAASFGASPGTTPLNYLQIYAVDFLYAAAHVHSPAQVVEAGAIVSTSAQDLLNLTSREIFEVGEPSLLRKE